MGKGAHAAWLLLFCLALAGVAAAETGEETPRRWGLGYDGGVSLRRTLGDGWDLTLAAGPDDERAEVLGDSWTTGDDGETLGPLPDDSLDTTESGWVRLDVARRVAGEGPASLSTFVSVRYLWSRGKTEMLRVDTWDQDVVTRRTWKNIDSWLIALGLRPQYRFSTRFSCEVHLGVSFVDEDEDSGRVEERRDADGQLVSLIEEQDTTRTRRFFDFGWYGTGALIFFFWF